MILPVSSKAVDNAAASRQFAGQFEIGPLRFLIAAHVLLFCLATVLAASFPDTDYVRILHASVALAHWGLLVIYLFLGSGKTMRHALAAAAVVWVELCFVSSPDSIVSHGAAPNRFLTLLLVGAVVGVPIVAMATEVTNLPLTVLRADGLRLRRRTAKAAPDSGPLQFPISRLLVMTVLAGVLFGIAQGGRTPDNANPVPEAFAIVLRLFVGAALVLSWTRMCVWVALWPGRAAPRLVLAAYLWLLGFLLFADQNAKNLSYLLECCVAFSASTAILLFSLLIARRLGYYAIFCED